MDFKKTRVKQIITAIKTTKENFQQLESEQVEDIKHFYLMSIENKLNMIQDYLQSLANDQPDELDKLQADYNNLLARYRGLQKRQNNLVDSIREGSTEGRFSQFSQSELNSIALALEGFNKDYKGIISESDYNNLMKEIKQEEEKRKHHKEIGLKPCN